MDDIKQHASTHRDDELITVTLEGYGETYKIQKALLCSASDYFVKALDGNFSEGREKSLTLPDCDEQVFQLFFYWLLNRDLPDFCASLGTSPPTDKIDEVHSLLVRTWAFAERHLIKVIVPQLTESMLTQMTKFAPRPSVINTAFEVSTANSKLRLLVVRAGIFHHEDGGYSGGDMDILAGVPGFFRQFVGELAAGRNATGGANPWEMWDAARWGDATSYTSDE